jgi:hypothetical protein
MSSPKPIVQQVSFFLSKAIQHNASFSLPKPKNSSLAVCPFTCPWEHQTSSIEEYVEYISLTADCSDVCFIGALCLLKKLEQTLEFTRLTQQTVHRVYFTCFLLAMKYFEDEVFSEKDHADIGNVNVNDLVEMQLSYLRVLKFNCTITPEDIKSMTEMLGEFYTQSEKVLRNNQGSAIKISTLFSVTAPTTSPATSANASGRRPLFRLHKRSASEAAPRRIQAKNSFLFSSVSKKVFGALHA